jgi:glycosyltransferase involved in cell wall biosynthesis
MTDGPGLVSVIVPVHDAAATLGGQLEALAAQEYEGEWELIVADDHSSDASAAIASGYGARVVASDRRGPNFARNAGARAAGGDFLAFCDADDVADSGWLAGLAAAATEGDMVAGWLDVGPLNDAEVRAWHETSEWELGHPIRQFMPVASTANLGVWRSVFTAVGGFSDEVMYGEDKDLAWRAQLAGYEIVRAPRAVVAYRYRSTARATAVQHFAWGMAGAQLYRLFRAHGLGRTRLRDSLRGWGWLGTRLPLLAFSSQRRGLWAVRAGLLAGQLMGSVRHRVVFL